MLALRPAWRGGILGHGAAVVRIMFGKEDRMSKVSEMLARVRELDAAATPGPWEAMAEGDES